MDGLVGLSSLVLHTLVNGSLPNRFTVSLQSRILHSLCLFILWLAYPDKDRYDNMILCPSPKLICGKRE
jgi:hypothetical protein